jgi:hypothetical protein
LDRLIGVAAAAQVDGFAGSLDHEHLVFRGFIVLVGGSISVAGP